jgi:tight adherence protein C
VTVATAWVVSFGIGATLLVSTTRWARRPRIAERLARHLPGHVTMPSTILVRDVVVPFAQHWGGRLSRLVGVNEEAAVRLERIHADQSVSEWRLRQFTLTLIALLSGAVLAAAVRPAPVAALLFVAGAPTIAFLGVEQQLAIASARRQRAVLLELPIVAEQLGMLVSAGYSVGAAVKRLARRGRGAIAEDLRGVCARARHGLSEHRALREWADISGVAAVERLVSVLALDREASDLGRLISLEARAARREVHRELVELMERRSQQVWIPVTVATLVPGVIFIAVPFIAAMQLFTAS